MAINESTLLAGMRQPYEIIKNTATAEGAGTWHSLWKVAGNPAAGATPPAFGTSGYVPTRATLGAIGQVNAAGGNELLAVALEASSTATGTLIIYDRMWACSGFGTVVTTAQNVVSGGTLTTGRLLDGSADYSDLELWGEVYTAPGASTATWTVTCPDGGNTSRSYTYTHPANAETVGQMFPFFCATAGIAAGVRVPTVFQASATSGTAGDIGLTVLRRIATIAMDATRPGNFKGMLDLALSQVRDDACLAMMIRCGSTTTGFVQADLGLSEVTP